MILRLLLLSFFLLCSLAAGACGENPLESRGCLPLEKDVPEKVNVLPLRAGDLWTFDYAWNYDNRPSKDIRRDGTVTLEVVDISSCAQGDSYNVVLEKQLDYVEVEISDDTRSDGTIVYDTTNTAVVDTIHWWVKGNEIRVATPFPGSVSRFAEAGEDSVAFTTSIGYLENPNPCCPAPWEIDVGTHQLVLARHRGISEYRYYYSSRGEYYVTETWRRR